MSEGFDIDFGKKKKKKPAVNGGVNIVSAVSIETAVSVVNDDIDYDYFALLAPYYVNNVTKVTNKELDLPPLKVSSEGTTKTVWTNIRRISKILNRDVSHVGRYITAELGVEGTYDAEQNLTIRGRFRVVNFQTVLRHYINEYVRCNACNGYHTSLSKYKSQRRIVCDDCHTQRNVDDISRGFRATTKKDRRDIKTKE